MSMETERTGLGDSGATSAIGFSSTTSFFAMAGLLGGVPADESATEALRDDVVLKSTLALVDLPCCPRWIKSINILRTITQTDSHIPQ